MSDLANIMPLKHTPFQRQSFILQGKLSLQQGGLLDIFNAIVLNSNVPFVSVRDFYKILRGFEPPEEWTSVGDYLYLKLSGQVYPRTDPDKYISLIVEPEGSFETSPIETRTATQEHLLANFNSIFKGSSRFDLEHINTADEKGRIFYELGKVPMDLYVLADLVMNDSVFSKFLAIDEHESATKSKRNSIYVSFFLPNGPTLKIVLTLYKTRDTDPVHRTYDFIKGQYHLSALVSEIQSDTDLEEFITIFGKLLTLYFQKAPAIIQIYKELLGKTKFPLKFKGRAEIAEGVKEEIPLSRIAPEVFVAGYPTKCPHKPIIVTEEEAVEAQEEGHSVMQYPKSANEGFQQRWYRCTKAPFVYPGLRSNELSNKELVPFLPCCFKKPQDLGREQALASDDVNLYSHYFYGKPLLDRKAASVQQRLVLRDIFVNPPFLGRLPADIKELLNITAFRDGQVFVRSGVFDSPSSFLECVLEAIAPQNPEIQKLLEYSSEQVQQATQAIDQAKNQKKNRPLIEAAQTKLWEAQKTERLQLLTRLRTEMAQNPADVASCAQEMYDYSTSEIQNILSDPNQYLDPALFMNLIQLVTNCNILYFSEREGIMKLPRHRHGYYKNDSMLHLPMVLIFERHGHAGESKEYPRCEIIAQWNQTQDVLTTWFHPQSNLNKQLTNIETKMRHGYALNCPIPKYQFIHLSHLNALSNVQRQLIDGYGKFRGLIFSFEGEEGTLLTTPMQPLRLPIQTWNTRLPRLRFAHARELCAKLNISIDREVVSTDFVEGLSGIWGNVRIVVPFVSDSNFIPTESKTIEKDFLLPEREESSSRLNEFTHARQVSRLLVEYAKWLYSDFLNQKVHETNPLASFAQTKLTIAPPTFSYGSTFSNKFTPEASFIIQDKLVLPSFEFKRRLLYVLRLFELYEWDVLSEYKDFVVVPNFFQSVKDFIVHPEQVILRGDEALSNWIVEQQFSGWNLHSGAEPDARLYFMQNPKILNGQICLMQKEEDLESAIDRSRFWKHYKINMPVEDESDPFEQPFILYSYKNTDNITEYSCKEQDCIQQQGSKAAAVLGYKNDQGEEEFVSVLPLGECQT
jgi:hypothetical protein